MDIFDLDESALTLGECVAAVRSFHQRIAAPIAATPRTLSCDPASALNYARDIAELSGRMAGAATSFGHVLLFRTALALEEVGEWLTANAMRDLVGVADALGDRFYVLLGDVVATGMPLAPIFEEIHRSNMSKTPNVQTGHGHGVKGRDYQAPDLGRLLSLYRKQS